MRIIFRLFTVFLTLVFLSSCSHINRKLVKADEKNPTPEISTDSEEDTHRLVEENKTDDEIKKVIGDNIDQEAEAEVEDEVVKRNHSRSNFLKIKKTKRVKYWINYFTVEQRDRFQRFLNNGEKYRPLIEEILTEEGVPTDLFYVGLIESGYYLGAKSVARATGPWQFIKGTGKRYGLKVNHELDERRDIEKATRAAARYFKDLYQMFDSWELALASYNAGEFGMVRRINKHGMNDYYELSKNNLLPQETINYVPKVIAAMYVVENAQKYGFNLPKENSRLWANTKKIKAPKNTSLSQLSRKIKVSHNLLATLNPELSRGKTPRFYQGHYLLRIPSSNSTANFLIQEDKASVKISNRLPASKNIKVSEVKSKKKIVPDQKSILTYYVRRGDTLSDLAQWFSIRTTDIQKANRLKSKKLVVGQKLKLPKTKKGTYTVKRGDYLQKVASKFNLPMQALINLNNLKNTTLKKGQRLVVNLL